MCSFTQKSIFGNKYLYLSGVLCHGFYLYMKHFTCIAGIYKHKCLSGMKLSINYSFYECFILIKWNIYNTVRILKISGNDPKLFIVVKQNTKLPPLRLSSKQCEANLMDFITYLKLQFGSHFKTEYAYFAFIYSIIYIEITISFTNREKHNL